jgi:hypothetical protein
MFGNGGRATDTAERHSESANERKLDSNKNRKFMNTLFKILAVLCVAALLVGLSDIGNGMFSGLARAAGTVCFVLAFITSVLQKADATA